MGKEIEIPKYWNQDFLDLIKEAENYQDLAAIALKVLENMPQPIGEVCGPISSGGKGSIKSNLEIFSKTILKLTYEKSEHIFNQLPMERLIQDIRKDYDGSPEESNQMVLEEFYKPIFESGLVKKTFFIPGWESSLGSCWENKKSKKMGIQIIYLPKNYLIE